MFIVCIILTYFEMNDEWCISAKKLSHVEVEPGNAMHSSVIDKSDINNKDYDTLAFWTPESIGAKIQKQSKSPGNMHSCVQTLQAF